MRSAISGKIIARATVRGMRKNVTAKRYGAEVSRKRKLLKKQSGKVAIPQDAFPRSAEDVCW